MWVIATYLTAELSAYFGLPIQHFFQSFNVSFNRRGVE